MRLFVCLLLLGVFASAAQAQLCVAETNAYRAQHGLPPYRYNAQLAAAAEAHNNLMVRTNCFAHDCGDGRVGNRAEAHGYQWSTVAENINSGPGTCAEKVRSWASDPAHNAALLSNRKDMGCAHSSCPSCQYGDRWTCDYGSTF